MNYTADSRHYIKIAEQIYQNGFISIWKNEQLVYWPPLYPILLSFLIGLKFSLSIKIFNYLVGIIILIVWDLLSTDILKNQNQRFFYMILLSLSTNLLMISVFVWSELVFLALFSLMILCFQKYLQTKTTYWLLVSVFPAFLMLLQRNAGIFVISSFYLALASFRVFSIKQLKTIVFCFLLSISGFLVWNIKNILIEDRLYMIRELVPYFTPFNNLVLVFNDIGEVIFPSSFIFPTSIFITGIIIIYIMYIIFSLKNELFTKVLLLSAMIYVSIWFIIPGDPSSIGRFISIVVPILLISVLKVIYAFFERFNIKYSFQYLLLIGLVLYSTIRVTNNSLLWGGESSYINFGKIHKNTFYEKSNRVIGSPPKE